MVNLLRDIYFKRWVDRLFRLDRAIDGDGGGGEMTAIYAAIVTWNNTVRDYVYRVKIWTIWYNIWSDVNDATTVTTFSPTPPPAPAPRATSVVHLIKDLPRVETDSVLLMDWLND